MNEAENQFEFEKFPRGPLEFKVDRRKFFTALRTAAFVVQKKGSRGGPVLKLSDLGDLPDEEIGVILPMVINGAQIESRNGMIWGKSPGSSHFIELFPIDSPAYTVYRTFTGLLTLDQIASFVGMETEWDNERCCAYVRGVFLFLVWVGIAQPRLPR